MLTRPMISPTLGAQIQRLLSRLPQAKWHQWDPGAAAQRISNTVYRFDKRAM